LRSCATHQVHISTQLQATACKQMLSQTMDDCKDQTPFYDCCIRHFNKLLCVVYMQQCGVTIVNAPTAVTVPQKRWLTLCQKSCIHKAVSLVLMLLVEWLHCHQAPAVWGVTYIEAFLNVASYVHFHTTLLACRQHAAPSATWLYGAACHYQATTTAAQCTVVCKYLSMRSVIQTFQQIT